MERHMNIGEAAEAAGVSPKMIRHYEQIGLVPAAARSESGYRRYGEREVSVLRFIRQSRRLGFSMEEISELLSLWSDTRRASRKVKAVAQRHLADLEEKMRELAQMKDALQRLIASCPGDDHPHCAIIDELAAQSHVAPQPGAPKPQPSRKRHERPSKPAPGAGASTHIDLMAWAAAQRRSS